MRGSIGREGRVHCIDDMGDGGVDVGGLRGGVRGRGRRRGGGRRGGGRR